MGAYTYNSVWRDRIIGGLRGDSRVNKARAATAHNRLYGAGTTMTGGLRSATEGIAAQEAVDASGIAEQAREADLADEEARRQEEEDRRIYEQERKDAQKSQLLGAGLDLATSLIPGVGGFLGGLLKKKVMPVTGAGPQGTGVSGQGAGGSFDLNPQQPGNLFSGNTLARFMARRRRPRTGQEIFGLR